MNEQQVADLFSEQVDRLLGGEVVADIPGMDDWSELATLGEQLSQVGFQPTPVAQAAFNNQLASWFGPRAGGSASAFLGMSKNSLFGLGAAIMAIGAGIGLVLLMGTILPGLFSLDPADERPAPATAESPAPVTPKAPAPPVLGPVETNDSAPNPTMPSSPSAAGDTLPDIDSSLRDTLPSTTPHRGDTLPTATATPTPTPTSTAASASPTEPTAQYIDAVPERTDAADGSTTGKDDDRGHGNDPDRYDEDNPGQSTGTGQNNNRDGGSSGESGGGKGGGKKN